MTREPYRVLVVRCSEQRRVYVYAYSEDGYRAALADLPGQGFEVERYPVLLKQGDTWSEVDMGRAYAKGEVLPACGARPRVIAGPRRAAAAAASTPPMLAPGSISSCRLSFSGFDDDKVGTGPVHQPDGRLDGHFKLAFHVPPDTEVVAVGLYSAVADGRPHGGCAWHSRGAPLPILGVYDGGRPLNPVPGPPLGRFSGPKVLDLYAADLGWFVAGNHVLCMVWLADGRALVDCAEIGAWGR